MPEDERAFATRVARYWARNPVALARVTYDRAATAVTDRSDKADGPTAGPETVDPLEFLAGGLVHLPDQGHVTTRYCGDRVVYSTDPDRDSYPVSYDVSPDGQRLLFLRVPPNAVAERRAALVQITNWGAEVRAKLSGKVP
ncbi:MAG: transposase [Gemmatimonadaceae bacterium]